MVEQQDSEDVEVVKDSSEDPLSHGKNVVLARDVFPLRLPIIPLDHRPIFPKMSVPMAIDDPALKKLVLKAAESPSKCVGLVLRKTRPDENALKPDDEETAPALYDVGVIAGILQMAPVSHDGPLQFVLGVLARFTINTIVQDKPYIVATVNYELETEHASNVELKAYSVSVIQSIKELVQLNPLHKEELGLFLSHTSLDEPGRLADFAAVMTTAGPVELQEILATFSVRARLRKALILLKKEIGISKLQVRIGKQIEEKLSKQQREFFLREQLKAIKKELGLAKEGKEAELERFEKRLSRLQLSDEAQERVEEEMEKLRLIEPASPEFNVSRTYLDWLTILPWGVFTKDSYDIHKATRILNRDHYGLEDVKERILEFLSVGILKGNISGSILCFVGPPGTGKTSIGQSIARSIGRHFYRFSVGGIRDEAEIKGHRRTYIGALPGKFIQAIRVCKSANPVIMLDEIDKIGASYHGDPASALLEVLDPEQNRDFLDHYLDVRFDLSNVFFICTANQMDTIPRPMLDRMEVIKLSGYILQEKMEIAQRFLLPKQFKAHGVAKDQLMLTKRAIREIIDGYAREAGVRGVENHIKKIIRKSVKQIVEGRQEKIKIDAGDVPGLLGKRIFTDENLYKKPEPGVVMGLAWTSMGGDTLYIEAAQVDADKPGFKQTGQLGSVMIESSEIAYTYVRSFLGNDEAAREFFARYFIHLHVPAGATPKDGPSAGLTMAAALYSLARRTPVRKGFAMTGELTLTGRIMPVGGIKEKTIAARRVKVKQLVFPSENQKDFDELPEHVRKGLHVHFVATFRDAVAILFRPAV